MTRHFAGARALSVLVLALAGSLPAMADNLILDGDFSAGAALTGWDITKKPSSFIQVKRSASLDSYLYVKDAPVVLSQTFASEAGQTLHISFDYLLEKTNPNQTFEVLFDSQTLLTTYTGASDWTRFDADVLSTGLDTLAFDFNTKNLALSTAMHLDNVSVVPTTSAVPEPASALLMAAALAGMVAARRRRGAQAGTAAG